MLVCISALLFVSIGAIQFVIFNEHLTHTHTHRRLRRGYLPTGHGQPLAGLHARPVAPPPTVPRAGMRLEGQKQVCMCM
jgi:hypothetical protein